MPTAVAHAAAAAVWITQRNCLAVLGLTPPAYLARVKAWKIPADPDGKMVITDLADWQRAREERLGRAANDSAPARTGADALLASIGLERRAGGAR